MPKYQEFVEHRFNINNRSGDEYMVNCCFHDSASFTMQVNVESGLFICFSCGARGGIKALMEHFGVSSVEKNIETIDIRRRLRQLQRPVSSDLAALDESYLERYTFPTSYWKERGFTDETIKIFDLGFDPIGDHDGAFVTIPLRRTNGELIGVIRRYLDPDVQLRYRYPKGFKRRLNMFGSWLAAEDESASTVALVEGSIDAMKVWQAGFPALAVYGSSLSEEQAGLLSRLGVQKVILFFDNDKAGRKCAKTCIGIHETLRKGVTHQEYRPETDLRRNFIVNMVEYPDGRTDPGEMTRKEITKSLRRAAPMI